MTQCFIACIFAHNYTIQSILLMIGLIVSDYDQEIKQSQTAD